MPHRRLRLFTTVLLSAALVVPVARGATFTVTSTGDGGDMNIGNGICADGNLVCTLRAAIEEANALPGADTIHFDIGLGGVQTIAPASALPFITDPVTIDGTTQPGFTTTPIIELHGIDTVGADGLNITAGNSTLRGLVINRFDDDGIELSTNGGNLIEGNFIGTDVTGTANQWNGGFGVRIDNVPGNTIGGTTSQARNLISKNVGGIYIGGGDATGNLVQGNYIGTDVTGTADLGNWDYAVLIENAPGNTIGGTTEGTRNLISGNQAGVQITGSAATGTAVQGNYIGTDVTGTVYRGQDYQGVVISDAPGNTIGGTTPGAGNVISAGSIGVHISGSTATGNVVQGNFIGTDVTGTVDLGNWAEGVRINAPGNTIGGATPGARNVISGNGDGVLISGNTATGNRVLGNYIGTEVTGTLELGNSGNGIRIVTPDNTIGGTTGTTAGGPCTGACNLISGNVSVGVGIGGGATITGNVVQGNFIGTDVTGTLDLGNRVGATITNGFSNTIGGTLTGEGNLISGNDWEGIRINGSDNMIQGNLIGTQIDGVSQLGNGRDGMWIWWVGNNAVGGTSPAAGNTIAYNGGNGVYVTDNAGNLVHTNSIHSNAGLGIDLEPDGATGNDAGDGDTGANDLQNFPVLTSAIVLGGSTTIEGTLNSTGNADFTLQFFSNGACDPSGYGEGESFVGSSIETTDGGGNVGFAVTFPTAVPVGDFITATATNPSNSTSEFSECVPVTQGEDIPTVSEWGLIVMALLLVTGGTIVFARRNARTRSWRFVTHKG